MDAGKSSTRILVSDAEGIEKNRKAFDLYLF